MLSEITRLFMLEMIFFKLKKKKVNIFENIKYLVTDFLGLIYCHFTSLRLKRKLYFLLYNC